MPSNWLCMPIDFLWNKKGQTIKHVHGLYMSSVCSLTDSGCNSVSTNWICHVPTQQQPLLPVSFSHLNDDVYMEGSLEQSTKVKHLAHGQQARWSNAPTWKNYLLDNRLDEGMHQHGRTTSWTTCSMNQCTKMEELPPGQHAQWINAQKWKNYLLDNMLDESMHKNGRTTSWTTGSMKQCTNMEELPPGQHARWINAQKWKNYLLDNRLDAAMYQHGRTTSWTTFNVQMCVYVFILLLTVSLCNPIS